MQNTTDHAPSLLYRWNGYSTFEDLESFLSELANQANPKKISCLLALPNAYLWKLKDKTWPTEIVFGAGSTESVEPGTFTESIATRLLNESNARFALVGNAENRYVLNESDSSINNKLHKLIDAKLIPFLCIGETYEQREENKTGSILTSQLKEALQGLNDEQIARIVIVYDAPWLKKSAHKFTVDEWKEVCDNFRQIVIPVIGQVASSMQFIFACPDEIDEGRSLLEKIHCAGFFPQVSNELFTLINAYDSAVLPERAAELSSTELGRSLFSEREVKTVTPQESLAVTAPDVTEEKTIPKKIEKAISKEIEELKISPPLEKSPEPKTLKEPEALKEEKEISSRETSEEEEEAPAAEEKLSSQSTEELEPQASSQEEQPSEEVLQEQTLSQDDSGISEEAISQESSSSNVQEEAPEDVLEGVPADAPIKHPKKAAQKTEAAPQEKSKEFSEEDLNERSLELREKEKVTADVYNTMKTKAERLHKLRATYLELLEKTTAALDNLPPDLKTPMTQGDLEFFKQNPDKFESAKPTLELIQKTNEIVLEAAAIPRDIDRMRIQAKDARKALQDSWDSLRADSLAYKKKNPKFQMPPQPLLLAAPPPEIDISIPQQQGPSSLTGKKIGIVRRPK
jgi:triosephosphate isomerase